MRIAFIINDIQDGYQRMIWSGIKKQTEELGIKCFTIPCRFFKEENEELKPHNLLFDFLNHNLFEGFIIANSTFNSGNITSDDISKFFNTYGNIPYVSISVKLQNEPTVFVDNPSGLRELTNHFIEKHGYKDIGFIRGPQNNSEAEDRYNTFKEVMQKHGLKINHSWIGQGNFEEPSGYQAMKQIWESTGSKPRAMLAANDNMILGAYNYLSEKSVKIPGAVALGGFDDVPTTQFNPVPISTIRQPIEEQAQEAVNLLYKFIRDKRAPQDVTLNTEALFRTSCSCVSPEVEFAGKVHKLNNNTSSITEDLQLLLQKEMELNISSIHGRDYIQKLWKLLNNDTEINSDSFQHNFLHLLEETLTSVANNKEELKGWISIFNVLFQYIQEQNHESNTLRLRVINQGLMILFEKLSQLQDYQAHLQGNRNVIVQQSLRRIMESKNMEELFSCLSTQLKALQFEDFILTFFDTSPNKSEYYNGVLPEMSTIKILMLRGVVKESVSKSFNTWKMLPAEILQQVTSNNIIVQMICYDDIPIGLMICDNKAALDDLYEALRAQVSSSIRTAQLIDYMEQSQEHLKNHNLQIEEELGPMLESIEKTMVMSRESIHSMSEAVSNIESNQEIFSVTSSSVEKIADNAQHMKELIGIINDISERINVLSINASIESTRAGNFGKGFAVIAGEVRKLADSTAMNATQTNETLRIVIDNINLALGSSRNSLDTYDQIRHQVQTLSNNMEHMMNQMNQLNEKSKKIMELIQ